MKVFGDHSTPQSPTHRELVEFSPAYASAVAAHLSACDALDAYLDGAIYGGPGWALRQAVLDTGKAVDTARAEATAAFLRSHKIPPPPEDNVSAYGYWEWCQQRGKSPADLDNAAEYCSGWAEASDAKGVYEWIKQIPMSDIMHETSRKHTDCRRYEPDGDFCETCDRNGW